MHTAYPCKKTHCTSAADCMNACMLHVCVCVSRVRFEGRIVCLGVEGTISSASAALLCCCSLYSLLVVLLLRQLCHMMLAVCMCGADPVVVVVRCVYHYLYHLLYR